MKIATWNVNSVKARLPNVLDYLASAQPDIVLLQEIKCQDEGFPKLEFEALGWHCAVHGQKSYNGVAILSRRPITDVVRGLPGNDKPGSDDDQQARYLEATVEGLRVASIYLPNGNPAPGEKFDFKLRWMRRLISHAKTLLATNRPFVLGGDYNVCPTDMDVYDPQSWRDDALCRPESRALYRELIYLGLTDSFRARHPHEPERYSFWDYQAGAWQRDLGVRIDHLLLSPQVADRLMESDIDKGPRGRDKASDHTPVWATIEMD